MKLNTDLTEIFDLIKGQDVFIFGPSPEIATHLLNPYGLEVESDTEVSHKPEPKRGFTNVKVNLSKEKHEQINDIFLNKWGFKDRVTIGLNLFSAFYDVTIAFWADGLMRWLSREILTHSNSKYFLTRKRIFTDKSLVCYGEDLTQELIGRITHVFNWCGGKNRYDKFTDGSLYFRNNDLIEKVSNGSVSYDLTYQGYLYASGTMLIAILYLCGVAGAKKCIITGAALNPLEPYHFYEKVNKGKKHNFSNEKMDRVIKSFIINFPNTQFIKTNPKSYLPFEYKRLKEVTK